jgi:DNA-binding winged helix-turn-helix (wHTH) protein
VTRIHEDIFDRSIDVQVARLRHKLEADPSVPGFIQTERGVGYVFGLSLNNFRNDENFALDFGSHCHARMRLVDSFGEPTRDLTA